MTKKLFRGETGWPLGNLEIEVEVGNKTDGDLVCVRAVEGKPFSYPPDARHPFDTVLQSDIYWSAYKWVRPSQLFDLPAENRVSHEISALEKMRAEFLATDDEYLHKRAANIDAQIKSILEVTDLSA